MGILFSTNQATNGDDAADRRSLALSNYPRRSPPNKLADLHKATMMGDWAAAWRLLDQMPELIRTSVSEGGETALHIAAAQGHEAFVAELLLIMGEDDLAIMNGKGCTALHSAATAGHGGVADQLLTKSADLANIKGEGAVWPLHVAVFHGFGDVAETLLDKTQFRLWSPVQKADLLVSAINSRLYGMVSY